MTAPATPSPPAAQITLRVVGRCPARALHVRRDGTFYLARHGVILLSADEGHTWSVVTTIRRGFLRRVSEVSRLGSRLLRPEVKALAVLADGTCLAADRRGVYYAPVGARIMNRCVIEDFAPRGTPPMTFTLGPGDRVLWGEYNSKLDHGLPIRLYVSDDKGRSFQVARVFAAGDIRHIHSVHYDGAQGCYWMFTGDYGQEPGIGRLSADLQDFSWVARGEQRFRLVEVFDFGDYLVYGTDSDVKPNAILRFEKATGQTEHLQELEGSCLHACRFGGWYVLSTTVERSPVNHSQNSTLWVSRDGERWTKVLDVKKDRWHPWYFQYGTIVLPRGESDKETVLFSGQALVGLDGKAVVARLTAGEDAVGRTVLAVSCGG